jgi:acyl-CoA thioesterase FadM
VSTSSATARHLRHRVFDDEDLAAAHGTFVHVFVDRATRKAVAIPTPLRAALERIAS